jgi:hypothetical protein
MAVDRVLIRNERENTLQESVLSPGTRYPCRDDPVSRSIGSMRFAKRS